MITKSFYHKSLRQAFQCVLINVRIIFLSRLVKGSS